MGLGLGIFLLVVGGVLAFAVQDSIDAVNLVVVGYVCLAAGVLSIVLSLVVTNQRRNTTHSEVIERRDRQVPPAV